MKCQTWPKKFCSTACRLCVETKYLVLYCLFQTINSISLRNIPVKCHLGLCLVTKVPWIKN